MKKNIMMKVGRHELGNILRLLDSLKRTVNSVYFIEGYTADECNICTQYIFAPTEWAMKRLCLDGISKQQLIAAYIDTKERVCEENEYLSLKIRKAVNSSKVWGKIRTDAPYLIPIFREAGIRI